MDIGHGRSRSLTATLGWKSPAKTGEWARRVTPDRVSDRQHVSSAAIHQQIQSNLSRLGLDRTVVNLCRGPESHG